MFPDFLSVKYCQIGSKYTTAIKHTRLYINSKVGSITNNYSLINHKFQMLSRFYWKQA